MLQETRQRELLAQQEIRKRYAISLTIALTLLTPSPLHLITSLVSSDLSYVQVRAGPLRGPLARNAARLSDAIHLTAGCVESTACLSRTLSTTRVYETCRGLYVHYVISLLLLYSFFLFSSVSLFFFFSFYVFTR